MRAPEGVVSAVHVGKPTQRGGLGGDGGALWLTGMYKDRVTGPVFVDRLNMAGDGQSHKAHGGADRAVCAYPGEHYDAWRSEFPHYDFPDGCFGENLTVHGQDETTVCVGDIYAIGDVLLQVSVPRSPCANLSRRCGVPTLLARVEATGHFGWLYRVLREGHLEAGQAIVLEDRPQPNWTVIHAYRTFRALRAGKADADASLADVPELATGWRETLAEALAKR